MNDKLSSKETAAFWEERWESGERLWDHGRPAPPLEEFVERHGIPHGEILMPGPGSGHDVRYLASLGARVTGLDVSSSAVIVAERENPHPNASYCTGNFLNPGPELMNRFDWIVEHTCMCSMNPGLWSDYAAAVKKALKPNGHFLAIFYRKPHDDDGPPFGIDEPVIDRLFGDRFDLLDAWIPEKSYASRAGREEVRWYKNIAG